MTNKLNQGVLRAVRFLTKDKIETIFASMNAATDTQIFRAAGFLDSNPLAAKIFQKISNQIGVTGWQIARDLKQSPKDVEKSLTDLVQIEVVRADGQGLNAYYAPSGQAYILRQRMAS